MENGEFGERRTKNGEQATKAHTKQTERMHKEQTTIGGTGNESKRNVTKNVKKKNEIEGTYPQLGSPTAPPLPEIPEALRQRQRDKGLSWPSHVS